MTTESTTPFAGKVALVAGASRGIGAVTARAFARAGADVVLAARDPQALEEVAEGIRKEGGQALAVPTDVGDAASMERLVQQAEGTFGRLDAAFNNTHHLMAAGEEAQRLAGLSTPMRRVGQAEEVAATVLWLCSDQSSFVTGVTVPIDGGQSAGSKPPRMYRQGQPMEAEKP